MAITPVSKEAIAVLAVCEETKKNFGITSEYLKNLGITGSEKLKTWYENFRNN